MATHRTGAVLADKLIMPDDFVINVKQIMQYALAPGVVNSDGFLFQRGGIGGPYYSIQSVDFLQSLLDNPDNNFNVAGNWTVDGGVYTNYLSVNGQVDIAYDLIVQGRILAGPQGVLTIPPTAFPGNIFGSILTVGDASGIGWNAWGDGSGTDYYWVSGYPAARFTFDLNPNRLEYYFADTGSAGAAVPWVAKFLVEGDSGHVGLAGSLIADWWGQPGANISTGQSPNVEASMGGGIYGQFCAMTNGFGYAWNIYDVTGSPAYATPGSINYNDNGPAGAFTYGSTGLDFSVAPPGLANTPAFPWTSIFNMDNTGNVRIGGMINAVSMGPMPPVLPGQGGVLWWTGTEFYLWDGANWVDLAGRHMEIERWDDVGLYWDDEGWEWW